jgi:hypothetical protein
VFDISNVLLQKSEWPPVNFTCIAAQSEHPGEVADELQPRPLCLRGTGGTAGLNGRFISDARVDNQPHRDRGAYRWGPSVHDVICGPIFGIHPAGTLLTCSSRRTELTGEGGVLLWQ